MPPHSALPSSDRAEQTFSDPQHQLWLELNSETLRRRQVRLRPGLAGLTQREPIGAELAGVHGANPSGMAPERRLGEMGARSSSSSMILSPTLRSSTSNCHPNPNGRLRNGTNGSHSNGVSSWSGSNVTSPQHSNLASPPSHALPLQQSTPPAPINSFAQAYIDQSRTLLDRQRRLFEDERALFSQERAMWQAERDALYARLRDVEELNSAWGISGDNKSGPAFTGVANMPATLRPLPVGQLLREHPASSVPLPDFSVNGGGGHALSRQSSSSQSAIPDGADQFWQGPPTQRSKPTSRTFSSSTNRSDDSRLAPIVEFPFRHSPSSQMSPQRNIVGAGVPVSVVNVNLDGIHLRSTPVALPPSLLVAQTLSSPPSKRAVKLRSASSSSSVTTTVHFPTSRRPANLRLVHSNMINEDDSARPAHIDLPNNSNFTQDAGHTPNAPRRMSMISIDSSGAASNATSDSSHESSTTNPNAASVDHGGNGVFDESPTLDSLTHEDQDDDPALIGQLSLENDPETDPQFLSELDMKLLQEARRIIDNASGISTTSELSSVISDDDLTERGSIASPLSPNRISEQRQIMMAPPGGIEGPGDMQEMHRKGRQIAQEGALSPPIQDPEPEIKLRMKRSTNFGSAFGVGRLGGRPLLCQA